MVLFFRLEHQMAKDRTFNYAMTYDSSSTDNIMELRIEVKIDNPGSGTEALDVTVVAFDITGFYHNFYRDNPNRQIVRFMRKTADGTSYIGMGDMRLKFNQ
jgi:hypothetical protein